MKGKYIFFFTLFVLFISGCVEEPCYESTESGIQVGFYTVNSNGVKDTTISKVFITSQIPYIKDTLTNLKAFSIPVIPDLNGMKLLIETSRTYYYDCDHDTNASISFDTTWVFDTTYVFDTIPMIDSTISVDTLYDTTYVIRPETCIITLDNKKSDSSYIENISHELTLNFVYDPRFINYDCGAFLGLDSLEAELASPGHIDSVSVRYKTVTNDPKENIQIYF